jgi:hypothetical protein
VVPVLALFSILKMLADVVVRLGNAFSSSAIDTMPVSLPFAIW